MSSPTVLVVDDEEYIVRILSFALRAEGLEVIPAFDGEEALKKVAEKAPDLIVLDLMMPVLDGYQVLRRLRSGTETREVPVIVLSAKGRDQDREAALAVGGDEYFTKPFSPQRLVERILQILASHRPA